MATIGTFFGLETGDLSEITSVTGTVTAQSTTVRTGAYALRCQATLTATAFASITCAVNVKVLRFYFRCASLPAAAERIMDTAPCRILLNATGVLDLQNTAPTSLGTSSAGAIVAGQWHRIDFKLTDTGDGARTATAAVDGVQFGTGSTSIATSTALRLGKNLDVNGSTIDYFYDDAAVSATIADYPLGAGQIVARQPSTGGTPTYNTWTKSSGTDAGALWDDTPFGTTDACNSTSTVNAMAQTATLSTFGSTQTGHGTETLATGSTINAAQVVAVGKTSLTTSGGNTGAIRRRAASADTDVNVTLTTSDTLLKPAVFVPSLADLNAMEIGFAKPITAAARTMTMEDFWVMVDYVPSPATSAVRPLLRPQFYPPRRRLL